MPKYKNRMRTLRVYLGMKMLRKGKSNGSKPINNGNFCFLPVVFKEMKLKGKKPPQLMKRLFSFFGLTNDFIAASFVTLTSHNSIKDRMDL